MCVREGSIKIFTFSMTFFLGLLITKFFVLYAPTAVSQKIESKQICVEESEEENSEDKIIAIPCDIDTQIYSVQSQEEEQLKVLKKSKFF